MAVFKDEVVITKGGLRGFLGVCLDVKMHKGIHSDYLVEFDNGERKWFPAEICLVVKRQK